MRGLLVTEFWREIYSALVASKVRALLTACGVFWGIFMLVTLLGIGKGMERGTHRNLSEAPALYIWAGRTSLPHRGRKPGRAVYFTNDDIEALQNVPGVALVAPRLQHLGVLVTAGTDSGHFRIRGTAPELAQIERPEQLAGRFLNHRDLVESRKVAVIGERVRRTLYGDASAIGQLLHLRGVPLLVVGEVGSDKSGFEGDQVRESVFVPLTLLQKAFGGGIRIDSFALTAAPGASLEVVELAVRRELSARHDVHPDDPDAARAYNHGRELAKVEQLFRGIRAFVWFVGTLTLLAGAIGVSNVLLIAVKERTREIGVRKALGATPLSVISMVLAEAVLLTSLAGYAGLLASVGSLELLSRLLGGVRDVPLERPEVDLTVAAVAVAILVLSGAAAGVVPAWHASKIRPVEALRGE